MTFDLLFPTTLAAMLVAWWNALIVLLALGAWAWVVSTVFDKDAARFYLPREKWNAFHIAMGALAVAVVLLVPLMFWITLPIMLFVLAVDLLVYLGARNRDERVPEAFAWSLNPATWAAAAGESKKTKKKDKAVKGITMTIAGPQGRVAPPEQETAEYNVRVAAEELLGEVVMRRATKGEVLPIKDGVYAVALTIDGLRSPIKQLSANDANAIVDYLKRAGGLDVEDRRRKQRATINFGFGDAANTEAWLSTMGSSQGVRAEILVDPSTQVDFKAKDLQLMPSQREALKEMTAHQSGVVLVSAPKGEGRTSLLYSMIREHDAYTSNIQILELDTQRAIEGVRHNVFDPQQGGEYSTVARSILRRDPDVVGIADMPDGETAEVVARSDTANTRVYLGMTELDPLQAVRSYVKAVGDPKLAAESLAGVVTGRLLRRLCENCRFASKPSPEILQKLGLPKDVQALYRTEGKVMVKDRPEPCPVCGATGYYGQVGAYAVHPIGDEERAFIASGDDQSLRGAWRQRKQPSVQTAALQLLVEGKTSVDELVRVLQGGGKKKPSSSKPAGQQGQAKPAAAKS